MFRSSTIVRTLLISSFATGLILAQDQITFSTLCFTTGAAKEPEYFIGNAKDRKKITAPITMLGGPFKAPMREGGLLDLFSSETDERPAITIKLPAASSNERLAVLFFPKDDGCQARAIVLPSAGFNGGSIFAINVAPSDLAIRYGNVTPKLIKPGASTLIAPPSNYKEPMIPVEIHKSDSAGGWQIEQRVRWPLDDRFKSYLFLYQSPENGRIKACSVPERIAGR